MATFGASAYNQAYEDALKAGRTKAGIGGAGVGTRTVGPGVTVGNPLPLAADRLGVAV